MKNPLVYFVGLMYMSIFFSGTPATEEPLTRYDRIIQLSVKIPEEQKKLVDSLIKNDQVINMRAAYYQRLNQSFTFKNPQ